MDHIQFSGNNVTMTGSLTYEDVTHILNAPESIKWIQFWNFDPSPEDLKLINRFFQVRPNVYLRPVRMHWIQYIPDVQNIIFYDFQDYFFNDLKLLKHVNGLDLGILNSKIDLTPLLAYKNTLTELAFEKDIKPDSEKVISQLINLKKVSFLSSKFTSLNFLIGLPIESLFLYGSRTMDYGAIAKLKSLKNFRLKKNTTWDNFDFLKETVNLENIELQYCSAITRFPELDHLQHLNEVIVDGNKLEDVSELLKLKNCKVYATGKILIKNKTVVWMDNRPDNKKSM